MLDKESKKLLLKLARASLEAAFSSTDMPVIEQEALPEALLEKCGSFVTLFKQGQLRGCIGNIIATKPLYKGVMENAQSAAFRDSRFLPLSADELDDLDIEVSVLTAPQQFFYKSVNELLDYLIPGKHGVILQKGSFQATFLPQVWESLSSKEAFLSELSIKSGQSSDAWQSGDQEVYLYETIAFYEHEFYL